MPARLAANFTGDQYSNACAGLSVRVTGFSSECLKPRHVSLLARLLEWGRLCCQIFPRTFCLAFFVSNWRGGKHRYEKSGNSGSLEFLYSGRGPNLQRRDLARHFLADHHARLLDRDRRVVGLDLSRDLSLDGLQLRHAKSVLSVGIPAQS